MKGYFVTGTDTGIGKTVVSAALCLKLQASYFKPIQTGPDSDTGTVQALSGAFAFPPVHHFPDPLSPHAAARNAGASIDPSGIQVPSRRPLVVEGAGGVMVPLNDRHLMLDLIQQIGLPVVVVASTRLGTINHTLLTLQALRMVGCQVHGVVHVGEPDPISLEAIEHHGKKKVLFQMPWLPEVTPQALQKIAGEMHGF
ncbi:dethiobiotin synthase [Deinococcus cellulosilyticus]|uniref:ATP-dependent dethiobiotin synthetase BioD n=1 Tax=Deinococcus cellulosilyticus (strain DSM 18568 / NBRC 106333 / KACC 11606 / 5516J-15) TaxID=1223518 RepID=A0A511N0S2_DEIC1|nr:dethiobiotin synthase [Deinococcus cellulosilyticus]GEM46057.1 hypothetical protein DC3_16920 [Deinococcus cellulosilyticus NBRC 106333 = KACC 11606]